MMRFVRSAPGICIALALGGWVPVLLAAPTPDDERPTDGDGSVPLAVTRVLLRCDGVDVNLVREELRLRAPQLVIEVAGDGDIVDQIPPYAHVVVHPQPGVADHWQLVLFLSNGAAYYRRFDAGPSDTARVTATMVIGLLQGRALAQLGPAPAPSELPITPVEPRPDPIAAPRSSPAPPRAEVGVAIAGGLLTGFGAPRDVDTLAAGIGSLLVAARLRAGATFALEMRGGARARFDYALARFGGLPHVGYTWRFDHAEIVLTGFVSIEYWTLRHGRGSAALETRVAGDPSSKWLLGGGARLAPGYVIERSRLRTRLGFFTSVSGATMARGGTARISVPDPAGAAIDAFRVGGFEWAIGLDVMFWPKRRNAASADRTNSRHDASKRKRSR